MQYVAANPQYADAGQYAVKFKTLQGRALNALRSKVAALLKNAVVQVCAMSATQSDTVTLLNLLQWPR